ncbi:hypothetical protein EZV73_10575 [Acidaminobacter sp. JC074]|uniref:CdaR family transcriptional regulator n=1 Tax=Acidaminobacter sp. JC074 TaxID=2530199 RepID=UPI001F0E0943|nr:sugar diacid recognition domain-containing protein [Acidaminobacter sp. JC074]MCH4888021.1 hypothetical protein [Acidaminobacter sp. JC074]
MELNRVIAQDIVDNISKIIEEDINLMNDQGIIIASTDDKRIGDFHGGAKKVLESRNELIIYFDNEYQGAVAGINLPIFLEDNIVGVIGITGKGKEVLKYGEIIKKMTEILIKEHLYNQSKQFKNEKLLQFFDTIITSSFEEDIDETWLNTRLRMFGLEALKKRRVIVIGRNSKENDISLVPDHFDYTSTLKKYLSDSDLTLYYQGNLMIVTHEVDDQILIHKLNNLNDYLKETLKIEFRYGIGNAYTHILDLKKSYNEGKIALKTTLHQSHVIQLYDQIDMGMIIDSIPKNIAERFFHKVFSSLDSEHVKEYAELIDMFVKENGSISKAADLMYIHKNTFQYRLNKLSKQTGYNPRKLNDLLVLYMAVKLKDYFYL